MTDQNPVPQNPDTGLELGTEEINAAIRSAAEEAADLAQAAGKVDLAFPTIGFIDPAVELEKMRRLAAAMPEDVKAAYPEQIRAALLAYHANPKTAREVTDEELALAIFIRRTSDKTLTPEEVEAKTTGKVAKKSKAIKATKEEAADKKIDDLLADL